MDKLLKQLSGSKGSRTPWAEIASLVRKGLAADRTEFVLAEGSFLLRASKVSGYSTNMLARYVAVLDFAETMATRGQVPLEAVKRVPFAIVETIRRAAAMDPSAGKVLVRASVAGRLSLMQAQEAYGAIAAKKGTLLPNKAVAARNRTRFEELVMALLKKKLPEFTGVSNAHFTRRSPPFDFVRVDATAFRLDGKPTDFIDGFEVKAFSERAPRTAVDDAVARVVLASTFYRRTWMVLQTAVPQLDRIVETLDILEMRSVGVAVADLGAELFRSVRHPEGEPEPDRRQLMREALMSRL